MFFLKYLLFVSFCLYDCLEAASLMNSSNENGWDNIFSSHSSSIPLFEFGEKSYYISKLKLDFLEAYQFCQGMQMRLVTIHSPDELDALTKFVRQTNVEWVWTSGSRLMDDKNWIWMSTLEPVEYIKWSQGQPDFLTEQCLNMWIEGNEGLYFNNENCNTKLAFICEKNKHSPRASRETTRLSPSSSLDSQHVPPIINFHFEGKGYYIGNYFKATFLQAIQFCQIIGMKLVSINSEAESKRLHKYIRDTIAGDNFWSSGSKLVDGKSIVWFSNGRTADYTNWLPNQPDNPNEMCVELVQIKNEGLFWNDLVCDGKLFFICEQYDNVFSQKYQPTLVQSTTDIESAIHYPENPTLPVTVINGVKYRVSRFQTTQAKALQTCKQYDMELVSILDKSKNDVVINLIQQHNNSSGYYWVSAMKQQDGKWMWWQLQPMVYTNWAPNEPNNNVKPESCLEFKYPSGQWNDLNCERNLYFICESRNKFNPRSYIADAQSAPIINIYVGNNQGSGVKNESITPYKKTGLSTDGEEYNVYINNITVPST